MPKAFLKSIALALLAVISAYYGHDLADGLAGACQPASSHAVLAEDSKTNTADTHHHRGMSCDQKLCHGLSGVMIGTEAIAPAYTLINSSQFSDSPSRMIDSRAIEPPATPPRV